MNHNEIKKVIATNIELSRQICLNYKMDDITKPVRDKLIDLKLDSSTLLKYRRLWNSQKEAIKLTVNYPTIIEYLRVYSKMRKQL